MTKKILYEVNAEIEKPLAQTYRDWLVPHIRKLLALPGFQSAEVFEDLDSVSTESAKFVIQYALESEQALENYLKGPAKTMRQEAVDKFGDRLKLNRRRLKLLNENYQK